MPTIANQPITRGEIRIFEQGDWLADISTNSDVRLANGTRVKIVAETLTLSGAIVRGGITESVGRYQVRGRPEWDTLVKPRAYNSAGNVLRQTVLADIAREALGSSWQSLVVLPDAQNLGRNYERQGTYGDVEEPAAAALERLGLSWYVRNDGVTVFGVRPSGNVTTDSRILVNYRNDAIGYRVVDCEDPGAFMPGLAFEGETIGEVTFALSADDIKMHLWSRATANASANWLRALFRRVFPRAELQCVSEYVVAGPSGDWNHDLRSIGSRHLPNINSASLWPGAAGHRATLPVGMRVGVSFLDSNPAKPILVCTEPPLTRALTRNPNTSEFYANETIAIDAQNEVRMGSALNNVLVNSGTMATWITKVTAVAFAVDNTIVAPSGHVSTKVKA